MSLLLDALKKAADEKKASQADNVDPSVQPADGQEPTSSAEKSGIQDTARDSGADQPASDELADELSLEAIEQSEPVAAPASDEELSLDSEQLEASARIVTEPVDVSRAGTEEPDDKPAPDMQSDSAPTLTPPVDAAVTPADRGGEHTVSDEALTMLIYNTNRNIRKNRIAAITSMVIISLLVLTTGGFYFYTDMQAEIAGLERKHRISMLAMQAKTNSEQAPRQSEIIRNLVSDDSFNDKVEYARQTRAVVAGTPGNKPNQNSSIAGDSADTRAVSSMSIQKSNKVDPLVQQLERAWQAYDAGDYARARQLYENVLSSEPDNRDALLGVGAVAVVEQDQKAAIEAYVRLLDIDPTDPIAGATLSDLRIGQADARELERYLLNMLKKNPRSSALNFALGNFYANNEKWHEAQTHYFDAWQNDATNADYLFNLAVSMDQLNKPDQALAFYRDSLIVAGDRQVRFSREAVKQRIAVLQE